MKLLLLNEAHRVLKKLKKHGVNLASAESCTGGVISTALSAASAGGAYYASGFVTYDDTAKTVMLGVKPDSISAYTAVSAEVVAQMAEGACRMAKTQVALAVSGYAGPDGGKDGTPAGTIWFAWYLGEGRTSVEKQHFEGSPESVVYQAAHFSLSRLVTLLND
ncbi:CinA family protein [Rahnella inusitata]|uniref:Nicotinamide-nucleotide amidohydrolase family protein n=1 Tax=Rahnella inusitata TaxID=58169 RepID=A0ABX9P009_9GAMM|nr:nicotinamide-nucleotide amidohydrolase family protein [Rahnella inusitata]RJT12786.1 nicotinamide-nucleotide amidohydrolase family protein [Rahnella inusitata]